MKNNAEELWINNLNVASSERVFSNSTIRLSVAAGDYLEIKQSTGVGNKPADKYRRGYVFINTTVTSTAAGYTLPVQAIASSPADAQTVYFGNLPKAPVTTPEPAKSSSRKREPSREQKFTVIPVQRGLLNHGR